MPINPPAVGFEGFVRIGGKGARCQVGNPLTTLFVKEADVDDHADDEDTSNFESAGFDSGTIGLEGASIETKGDWDSALIRFAATPGIFPRDDLQQRYYINVSDALWWQFPYSRVLSCKTAIPTRTLISFDWSSKSNATFTRPDAAGD